MSNSKLNSISGSDLIIDAKFEQHQMCGSKHCPGCGHKLEARPDWVGLPAGVKFDPTDQELIEHLEAKVKAKDMKSHPLIDEFIPTIEGEDGICYTHPEKLPGVTRDGLSRHFFHRPSKAYTTGTRKRRKIQTECDLQGGETRWHKTGKTRPVMSTGKQKGCKKILVLYTNFGKNRKPEKTNWVMHQYHLGQHEEEKEGELVVSKIFYQTQPRQCNWTADRGVPAVEAAGTGDLRRDSAGSGSCSSKEMEMGPAGGLGGPVSGYGSLEIHQFKSEYQFEMREQQRALDSLQHQLGFHVSQPQPHQLAAIISSPPPLLHHHASMVLDQGSYHMIQNEGFQEEDEREHHKVGVGVGVGVGGRSSASGLEELIMGCTSSSIKQPSLTQESSMGNPRETEWMKYSSFWPDPDNPHLHGHG